MIHLTLEEHRFAACGYSLGTTFSPTGWTGPIVVGFEATVAASIIGQYISGIHPALISLILVLALTATTLYCVGSYGEFWFAGIKVAAIVHFIVLGALFVIGLWEHD